LESSLLQILELSANFGVGTLFAVIILVIWMKDRKALTDMLDKQDTKYCDLVEADIKAREENTKAITELIVLIKALKDQMQDVGGKVDSIDNKMFIESVKR
jgi:hypothetical protein